MTRGRVLLRGILGVLLVLVAAPFVAEVVRGDTSRLVLGFVTVGVTAGVFFNVLRGAMWARHLTVFAAMIGGILLAVIGVLLSAANLVGLFVLAVGVGFIACGLGIIASPAIDAYLTWARRHARRR